MAAVLVRRAGRRKKYGDSTRRKCPFGEHDLLLPGEEERPIAGIPYYTITSFGRVITYNGTLPKILRTTINNKGYVRANVLVNGRYKVLYIHTAVCRAFHGEKPAGCTLVRHLNDDKRDNRSVNLAYGTHADNMQDAIKNNKFHRGSHHRLAKITEQQAREIKIGISNGENNIELAHKFNLSPATIRLIRIGQNWAHIQI